MRRCVRLSGGREARQPGETDKWQKKKGEGRLFGLYHLAVPIVGVGSNQLGLGLGLELGLLN